MDNLDILVVYNIKRYFLMLNSFYSYLRCNELDESFCNMISIVIICFLEKICFEFFVIMVVNI